MRTITLLVGKMKTVTLRADNLRTKVLKVANLGQISLNQPEFMSNRVKTTRVKSGRLEDNNF